MTPDPALGMDVPSLTGAPVLALLSLAPAAGALLALGSAAVWACSTVLWKPAILRFGAPAMNLFKCAVCALLLWITLLVLLGGTWLPLLWTPFAGILAISGILGLALGDGFLFLAVQRLGAQPAMVLMQLTPIFSAIAGWLWFGEALRPLQYLGVVAVCVGVVLVVVGRDRSGGGLEFRDPRHVAGGLLAGLTAPVFNALGFQLAKVAVADVDAALVQIGDTSWVHRTLLATTLRMTPAALALLAAALVLGRAGSWTLPVRQWMHRRRELLAVLVGTYLGVLMYQASLEWVAASVTACLASMTPVFLLPLAHLYLGERFRSLALFGTLLAVAGVPLLLL